MLAGKVSNDARILAVQGCTKSLTSRDILSKNGLAKLKDALLAETETGSHEQIPSIMRPRMPLYGHQRVDKRMRC